MVEVADEADGWFLSTQSSRAQRRGLAKKFWKIFGCSQGFVIAATRPSRVMNGKHPTTQL